ncbi:hypothetical protein QQ73_05745, partial [Candidatus Endoriftia persephone str. Guaymas]|nr:hypothetical protein [Candidatus Endoriftia persephone str. Guaymas]
MNHLLRYVGEKAIEMRYANDAEALVQSVEVELARRQRFSINDQQIEQLARHAVAIEAHYGQPMDIEWALDGNDGELYIVQARPETVQSRSAGVVERYSLPERGELLCEGRSIGA